MQLKWQVDRNEALARNYRKELDEAGPRTYCIELVPIDTADEHLALPSETSQTARVLGSIISSGLKSPSEKRTVIKDDAMSDAYQSDAEQSRLRRREHLTQRFTLEDGSEVKVSSILRLITVLLTSNAQLTQIHLGRDNENEPARVGRSVPVMVIDSPTSDTARA
jgi:hypothetical protein